jgi:tryptophan synthase beta chain
MVRTSYESKPYRRVIMETWGAECVPSPVDDPSSPGSLGMAISDAVRDAATRDDTHYSLGSVLNHVLLHQTVIGQEAKEQLAMAGERLPDVVIAPCGGGSNLGGLALPFIEDTDVRLVAAEPSSCPTLTEGRFDYDFGDTAGPHAAAPDVHPRPRVHAAHHPRRRPALPRRRADHQPAGEDGPHGGDRLPAGQGVRGGRLFANAEGKVAAPEACHGILAAIDEALAAKETGEEKVILFNYCGPRLSRSRRLRRLQPRPPGRRLRSSPATN